MTDPPPKPGLRHARFEGGASAPTWELPVFVFVYTCRPSSRRWLRSWRFEAAERGVPRFLRGVWAAQRSGIIRSSFLYPAIIIRQSI
jgi:hypothetical protein